MPLTRDQAIESCGEPDDMRVATIFGTGAKAAKLTDARGRFVFDDQPILALGRNVSGGVAGLVDLPKADEADWDDD